MDKFIADIMSTLHGQPRSAAPERALSVSPPAKRGSRVRNPEAAVTRVSAPATPSLAAPPQNTWSHTTCRKGARCLLFLGKTRRP